MTPDAANGAPQPEPAANDAVLESLAAAAPPASASSAEPAPVQRIAALEEELRQARDRELRTQAELENARKRMRRELEDERRYAAQPLLTDLLPVLDNLERALAHASGAGAAELGQGVQMVVVQLREALSRRGCQRIETVGVPFDPHVHQALGQEPSTEHPAGTVVRELQAGYRLHDRVLRPAGVMIAT